MFSIKRKKQDLIHDMTDSNTPMLTLPRDQQNKPGGGFDVNLIRMVAEHGPRRVAEIERELESLNVKMMHLREEEKTIKALIQVAITK